MSMSWSGATPRSGRRSRGEVSACAEIGKENHDERTQHQWGAFHEGAHSKERPPRLKAGAGLVPIALTHLVMRLEKLVRREAEVAEAEPLVVLVLRVDGRVQAVVMGDSRNVVVGQRIRSTLDNHW